MGDKKFVIGVIVVTIFLLVGAVVLAGSMGSNAEVAANPQVLVVVSESSHDWGEIGLNDGNVEKVFTIKNEGSENLTLTNIATSCMCTTAQLALGDNESPLFGMHSKSDYSMHVPPGEAAQLAVVFDPAFHGPSGVGPINRQVTVSTNDPKNPTLTFLLNAVVRQ
ncbi:DUF1573 domain-containing protein [Candidatus Microgenomates bacterium]|nr:MAG: DUF1573 domain-containing protein [Candidatus Microgenomates bacterium]